MLDINLIRNNPGLLTWNLQVRGMAQDTPSIPKLLRSHPLREVTGAQKCRRNGWQPGTRLAGDEGYGVTVIEITAIGERNILAKAISHDGKPLSPVYESTWDLSCRKWRKVR